MNDIQVWMVISILCMGIFYSMEISMLMGE